MSPFVVDCIVVGSTIVGVAAVVLYVRAMIGFERSLDELAASSASLVARRPNA